MYPIFSQILIDFFFEQVLTVLWSKNVFEVEETMYFLIQKSLVQFEKDTVYSYSYGIHDLYLEILKEICESDIQVSFTML